MHPTHWAALDSEHYSRHRYTGPMYEKYNAVLRFNAAKNDDGSVRTE